MKNLNLLINVGITHFLCFCRWSDNGRRILAELLLRSDKDPKEFVQVYDGLLEYLDDESHLEIMAEELKSRNVQCLNFYDIVLDYILIDSFEVRMILIVISN